MWAALILKDSSVHFRMDWEQYYYSIMVLTDCQSHAPMAMTAAEKVYEQIEKDPLGLVYGCSRFHDLLHCQILYRNKSQS